MEKIKAYFYFKHTRFILFTIILCIGFIGLSYITMIKHPFISNVCGNIFAGLVASIIITIYTNIRGNELGLINGFVNKLNNANLKVHNFLETYNGKQREVTKEIVENAFDEYQKIRCELDKLEELFYKLNFTIRPQPAVGDNDPCVDEMIQEISLGLHQENHAKYEDYLLFMIDSCVVMYRQNSYVINYCLLTYLNVCNKMPL